MVTAMTIAGSDSSGGAGIQADLATFHRFTVYGTSVITAVTAQNSLGISKIFPIPADIVLEQYVQVITDIGADAVKTGMMVDAELILALKDGFDRCPPPKLVVDPVMISSSGDNLLEPSAVSTLIEHIVPRATLIMPNLNEAVTMIRSGPITTVEEMEAAAEKIHSFGPQAVLVKGGHLPNTEDAVDIFYDGNSMIEYRSPRLSIQHPHGTGCVYSAAITARLARGDPLPDAVRRAKDFVSEAISNSLRLGDGTVTLHPFMPGNIETN